MRVCSSCQREFDETSGAGTSRLCPSCRRDRLVNTWKRQMRNYGVSMMVGLAVLGYVFLSLKGHPHTAMTPLLKALMAVGGLFLMGGLFGFSLALFFHFWHRKKNNKAR